MSNSLQPHGLHSMPAFPILLDLQECDQSHVHWVSDAIQSSHPLSSPSLLALNLSQHQGLFHVSALHIRCQSIGASAPMNMELNIHTPMNIQDWFLLDWLAWSPCGPRDSQETSLAQHFKSISSLALGLLYSLTLTSVHDYWKKP